jgi:hypothetical protein
LKCHIFTLGAYGGNNYYGNYGGGGFYGKPSYSFMNPYGAYALSGYEGPPYGMNNYWQPGAAYPPYYQGGGGYGAGWA